MFQLGQGLGEHLCHLRAGVLHCCLCLIGQEFVLCSKTRSQQTFPVKDKIVNVLGLQRVNVRSLESVQNRLHDALLVVKYTDSEWRESLCIAWSLLSAGLSVLGRIPPPPPPSVLCEQDSCSNLESAVCWEGPWAFCKAVCLCVYMQCLPVLMCGEERTSGAAWPGKLSWQRCGKEGTFERTEEGLQGQSFDLNK